MKTIGRYGFILGVICMVASGLLAAINAITRPQIAAQLHEQEEKTLSEVLPQARRFEAVTSSNGDTLYYKAYNKDNKFIGVAFKASGKGYSGTVETMAGIALDGKISAIKVLSQNETPGLGNRITEPPFTAKFVNKNISGLEQVQAIAGATISSKAVMDSVKKRMGEIASLMKNEK